MDALNIQTITQTELRKAACCNLSESFETNASIDASFTDAVTGTRQIKMLGLSGRYSQILKDNIPNVRGLATTYGLSYIPGDWIDNIHISKGAGSVTSGFESITGEINVAIKDADTEEKTNLNIYGNQGGRMELNANSKWKVSEAWRTILLAHAEINDTRMDRNNDGFMDNPLKRDFVIRNQWKFQAPKHWEGQYAINFLKQHHQSGQLDFEPENITQLWGMHLDSDRLELSGKTGYVFDDAWVSSIGSQFSFDHYDMQLNAGNKRYSGEQNTFRANLLYNTKLGCAKKGLTVGLTALQDNFTSALDSLDLSRSETVLGVYGEFTWKPSPAFSAIVGMRGDQHNLFGFMYSPRLHMRYLLSEDLSAKAAIGRGYRTVNPVMDNLGLLASNRAWNVETPIYQESGWNAGLNLTYAFRLDYREASLAIDAYRTQFDNMAVVDFETPGAVHIYALSGQSYSNTAQAEFSWEMMRRTDIRLAYRYTDAQTDYESGQLVNPFNPNHRGFLNLSYETKKNDKDAQWKCDATVQFIGDQRMPDRFADESGSVTVSRNNSPRFVQVHGQLTRIFKKGLQCYIGIENASDYRLQEPILGASQPFSQTFDASQVYGPVFGRMTYLGLRWTLY
jgi:outer membrane receptor for ferrienterochelin and colicin